MTKRPIVTAAFAGGLACALSPVVAQDAEDEETGSLRQRLRIEQEFGVGDNLGLEVPSEGSTSLATTRLTYGVESKTNVQDLAFAIGGALRFGNVAEGNNISTGFVDPLMGLRYNRDTGNASFSLNADYRETDISLSAPLWTFLDQDGIVRLPRDFTNIRGSGDRRAYVIDAGLETGKQAPFGLRFLAGASGTNYLNATDPSLTDYDTTNFGVSTLFRFNKITTGFVDLRYYTYDRKDSVSTERETQSLEAGFDREVSERARLTFRAGYTDVDTYETNPVTGLRSKTQRSGPSGRIGYLTEMPNGTFDSTFDLIQNQTGQRGTLRFTRSLGLPSGSLSANIGLTSFDSTDPRVIGGITWSHQLPASEINVRFARDVFVDSNDEDRFTNVLIAGYQHDINTISSLSADMSFSYAESSPFSEATKRGNLAVVYSHQLTKDWSFNTGVEFRFLDEDPVGRADSTSVFFGIGRNFDMSN